MRSNLFGLHLIHNLAKFCRIFAFIGVNKADCAPNLAFNVF